MSETCSAGSTAGTSTSGWGAGAPGTGGCASGCGIGRWDEFDSTSRAWPILAGTGNEDDFLTDYQGGFAGMSFRFFDPETRQWSIYWADSRRPACSIRP